MTAKLIHARRVGPELLRRHDHDAPTQAREERREVLAGGGEKHALLEVCVVVPVHEGKPALREHRFGVEHVGRPSEARLVLVLLDPEVLLGRLHVGLGGRCLLDGLGVVPIGLLDLNLQLALEIGDLLPSPGGCKIRFAHVGLARAAVVCLPRQAEEQHVGVGVDEVLVLLVGVGGLGEQGRVALAPP